jgi:hypothetical protein
MHRLSLIALLSLALRAQDNAGLFNKPPAGVDEALRARITAFYQHHVKQEFRLAEALVAEDTKDFFYRNNKPQYLSFEIRQIDYSKDFTRAKAIMVCEQYFMMPGFMDKPIKAPVPSTWKLENGQWFWYVDKDELSKTPFGKMKPGAGAPGGGLPTLPAGPDFALGKVRADRNGVSLKPGESAVVKFTNNASGYMTLKVTNTARGVEAAFDEPLVKPGGEAVLTISAGKQTASGTIDVQVVQTLEHIGIAFTVK